MAKWLPRAEYFAKKEAEAQAAKSGEEPKAQASEVGGVYNITDIAKEEINDVETTRRQFSLSISRYTSSTDAVSDLLDITIAIRGLLDDYFHEKGLRVQAEGYTIAEYQNALEEILEKRVRVSPLYIRKLTQNISKIWAEGFMRPLNIVLPTQAPDFKRRFAAAFYSVLGDKEFGYDKFHADYLKAMKILDLKDAAYFDWTAYCISRRPSFDLDTNIGIIGPARISKSTLMMRFAERINEFWWADKRIKESDFDKSWPLAHIAWDAGQGFEAFRKFRKNIIANDESYFTSDRRQSMNKVNIRYLQMMNALASYNNIVFTVIQNYQDLDSRIKSKLTALFTVYERGSALAYCSNTSFPVVKSQIIDTKKFEDSPGLLQNKQRALWEMKKFPSYCYPIHYIRYNEEKPYWDGDFVWKEYKAVKSAAQDRIIEMLDAEFSKGKGKDGEDEGEDDE